jgi:hypothetical protein
MARADMAITAESAPPPAPNDHLRLMLIGGALMLLINFAAPMNGLIAIPVAFFLSASWPRWPISAACCGTGRCGR